MLSLLIRMSLFTGLKDGIKVAITNTSDLSGFQQYNKKICGKLRKAFTDKAI